MTNPYLSWIKDCEKWITQGKSIASGDMQSKTVSAEAGLPGRGALLMFSPHPDDESIIGALPLRLGREADMVVANIAVTLGSKLDRRAGRWAELCNACSFLGWTTHQSAPNGLEKISPKGKAEDPVNWQKAVAVIRGILEKCQPSVVVFPHAEDSNATHIGVHHLVMEALAGMPASFTCAILETEFWAAMATPNLMIESRTEDVADMVAAVSMHVGEVQRNPYHLTLPAWMQDNVRRGGEIVGGQGGAAPDYKFATLYRLRCWKSSAVRDLRLTAKTLSKGQSMREWWSAVQSAIAAV